MMTQADILGKNQDPFLDTTSRRANKPTGFDEQFPEAGLSNLSEQSPIRPSKYFATDSAINTSKGLRRIITGGLVFSLIVTTALFIQIIVGGNQVPNRIGIVTPENVCSEIGADMVRMGGNSVDAYIASLLCLSVVNPFAAGLGAGGFLVIRDHKRDQNYAVNCFFRSSVSIKPPLLNPVVGIRSIATPGELKCLQHAYHRYARFYWKTLTAPSIDLARKGFKMSSSLARYVQLLDKSDIEKNPQLSAMFLNSNGTLKKEGDIITNPKLADTLSLLNRQEYLLYHSDGSVGRDLVKELSTIQGQEQITEGDLTSYMAQENELETVRFNDFMLLSTEYPSAGPAVRFIMELMKVFPTSVDYVKSTDFYNRVLEASKLGYILASYASDPTFGPNQETFYNEKLTLAKTYIKNLNSSEYPFERTNVKIKDDFFVNFVSVNDHNDYMVSYVGTLGSIWGSKFMSENGYFLNNGLSLFSYDSTEPNDNSPALNKQPRGLMAPILTYNVKNPCIRRFSISYGHKGEQMNDDLAFSELAQVITKILTDFSLYESALSDKRAQFSPQSSESQVCFEAGFDTTVSSQIINQGKFKASNSCMYHAIDLIMKKDHVVYGQADLTRSTDSLVVFN